MKYEFNADDNVLRLVPTSEEDERTLYRMQDHLGSLGGSRYLLRNAGGEGSLDSVKEGRLDKGLIFVLESRNP